MQQSVSTMNPIRMALTSASLSAQWLLSQSLSLAAVVINTQNSVAGMRSQCKYSIQWLLLNVTGYHEVFILQSIDYVRFC